MICALLPVEVCLERAFLIWFEELFLTTERILKCHRLLRSSRPSSVAELKKKECIRQTVDLATPKVFISLIYFGVSV